MDDGHPQLTHTMQNLTYYTNWGCWIYFNYVTSTNESKLVCLYLLSSLFEESQDFTAIFLCSMLDGSGKVFHTEAGSVYRLTSNQTTLPHRPSSPSQDCPNWPQLSCQRGISFPRGLIYWLLFLDGSRIICRLVISHFWPTFDWCSHVHSHTHTHPHPQSHRLVSGATLSGSLYRNILYRVCLSLTFFPPSLGT